jgi:hypothetical protein
MAIPGDGDFFHGADRHKQAVWVVVDPRDLVTGDRVLGPLKVGLKGVTAEPIAARAGVYCFMNLALPAAKYVVEVRPISGSKARYFDATEELNLVAVPVAGQPLKRNPVVVQLLPRPEYPFDAQRTLVRGRLVKASDQTAVPSASVGLVLQATDLGIRARTDERGAFAVCFPRATPGITSTDSPKDLSYQLRFELTGQPSVPTPAAVVREGTTKVLAPVQFPGI